MANIVRNETRVWVGPWTNYGFVVRSGWSRYFPVADTYEDYIVRENVYWNNTFKAIHLMPDYESFAGVSMQLSDFSITAGDFDICIPPNFKNQFIHAYNCTAGHSTSIRSNTYLPAEPHFFATFVRTATSSYNQAPAGVSWSLTFGGGYKLEWSIVHPPVLYKPDGTKEYYQLPEGESDAYFHDTKVEFNIHNIENDLHIYMSTCRKPWIIRDVGILPSAKYTVTGVGHSYAFNVQKITFEREGYFETDWIDCRHPLWTGVPLEDNLLIGTVFPSIIPANCSATITVAESDGYKKRFRVWLRGDGLHTPFIQGWQAIWEPVDCNPIENEQWTEITPWYAGGTEQMGYDLTTRTATYQLKPYKVVYDYNGMVEGNLFDYLGWDLRGNFAICHTTAYYYDDGHVEWYDRLYGLAKVRRESPPLRDVSVIEVTAYDRAAIIKELELHNPPCLLGMNVGVAIAKLANWAGIPNYLIYIHDNITDVLTDPGKNYDHPRFLESEGTTAGQAINKICEKYDIVAEIWPDQCLHIYQNYDFPPDPIAKYYYRPSSAMTGTDWLDLSDFDFETDQTSAENVVLVKGWELKRHDKEPNRIKEDNTDKGEPLYAYYMDEESLGVPGSDRYLGYYAIKTITEEDIHDPAGLMRIAYLAFKNRKGGWPTMKIKGPSLWRRIPREIIVVYDREIGGYLCEVQSVSVNMKLGLYDASATVKVLCPFAL